MWLSGHYMRRSEVRASKLILWNPLPSYSRRKHNIIINNLIADNGLECIYNLEIVKVDWEMWQVDFVAAAWVRTRPLKKLCTMLSNITPEILWSNSILVACIPGHILSAFPAFIAIGEDRHKNWSEDSKCLI